MTIAPAQDLAAVDDGAAVTDVLGPWHRHRQAIEALAPAASASQASDKRASGVDEWLASAGPDYDFLAANGLAALWIDAARHSGAATDASAWNKLREDERSGSALYMAQSIAVRELTAAFNAAAVRFALMKGVAWRDELYDRPHLRFAADIDVLIAPADRQPARATLAALGFGLANGGESAHEETWSRGSVDIDLHWDLLAPGRIPSSITTALLSRRVATAGGGWRLCDADMVAVTLIHTAVTKYVCCRHSALSRVVDLLNALERKPPDWDAVATLIEACGLRGAAWATMTWIDLLVSSIAERSVFPAAFRDRLVPARWRRAYLETWVRRDWPGRLEPRYAWLVRSAFTLPMHDSVGGALQAVRGRLTRAS